MASLKEQILTWVGTTPGLTDQELANEIFGPKAPQQSVNQAARALADKGQVQRRKRKDGKIGNYAAGPAGIDEDSPIPTAATLDRGHSPILTEDEVKRSIQIWLEAAGWKVQVIWGKGHGIDIEAQRDGQRWLIEAKGGGSRDAMRVNYFLAILGELLQRMNDLNAHYSIALPGL
jgi:hypothetical protein